MDARTKNWMTIATFFAAGACGGKEVGQVNGDSDSGSAMATVAPSCAEICSHVIGSCVPGASIDGCSIDCERTRREFAACPQDLDPYLVCTSHAHIVCQGNDVIIADCSPERNRLESCLH